MFDWTNSRFDFILPTRIVFGFGCIESLPQELTAIGGKRPLLVTDSGVRAAGILDRVVGILRAADISCNFFDGVEANPKDRNVAAGAAAYREANADSIIGLGGGSAIDCAKAIGVLAANDAVDIKPYEGKSAKSNPLPPLLCVPTTAGTGSELTFSSVITDTKHGYKMTIKNAFTAARTAVCDPALTLSVPPEVTPATGMDALTHAIEAYTASCAEPISDSVALYAIELIYQNLRTAVEDGKNMEARSAMLMGSMLAGIAFSHSDVAAVHCISEALGGMYDLPHGVCNAVILPHIMEYSMEYCPDRYARVARAMGLTPDIGKAGAQRAVEAVQRLAEDVRLPSFASLNVDPASFKKIAEASARNISSASNPRPMGEAEYMEVLEHMHAQA